MVVQLEVEQRLRFIEDINSIFFSFFFLSNFVFFMNKQENSIPCLSALPDNTNAYLSFFVHG